MPALSPTMSQGNISEWKKKVGLGWNSAFHQCRLLPLRVIRACCTGRIGMLGSLLHATTTTTTTTITTHAAMGIC
jgi:hypothetical protein